MLSNKASYPAFKGLMLFLTSVACASGANEVQQLSTAPTKREISIQEPQLKLSPEAYKGKCPVDIRADGLLMATDNGIVKYRWVYKGAMGEVVMLRLSKNETETVTTTFKAIGKTLQPGTLLLSSAQKNESSEIHSDSSHATPFNLHSGTVQLLSLPVDEQDWRQARQSREISFKVECEEDKSFPVNVASTAKANLQPGPMLSISGAKAPWGSTLVVDASQFQTGRRGKQCPLSLAYEVLNQGMAQASASQAKLMSGTQVLSVKTIGDLAPEAKVSVTDTIYLSEGRHTLSLKLDNMEQLDESSESNNVQWITLQVLGCSGY